MSDIDIKIYTEGEELPPLVEGNFFHSLELFRIIEKSPGDTPFMATAMRDGTCVAQMLVILHRRGSLIPPYIYTHAHVHGEGCYATDADCDLIFPKLLKAITLRLRHKLCFYIEFSELGKKMFGYRHFRRLGYFPIAWQEIHNSLHSKSPEERISDKQLHLIQRMKEKGVVCREAENEGEIKRLHQILRQFYRFKPRRFIPSHEFFGELERSEHGKVFVTTYGNKIIGGCACVFDGDDAYLWYAADKRKSYAHLHPDMMTIWNALSYSHQHGYNHFNFMDAGLPWNGNKYREFILGFGGKPVAKLRWFRFYTKLFSMVIRFFYKQ